MTIATIDFDTADAVWIRNDLYIKTPEALETVLNKLREIGYDIQDERTDGYSVREGRTTPEKMEQGIWCLWSARLNIRTGKCGSCHEYISTLGIRKHGHTCEKCGEITYLEIVDDKTDIRFQFVGDYGLSAPALQMRAAHWDVDNGLLYLHPEPLESRHYRTIDGEKAQAYLNAHKEKWEFVEYAGTRALRVRYNQPTGISRNVDDTIEIDDIFGSHYNHSIVNVWQGKEYREYDQDLPVPESISIYETWRWAPLSSSPDLYKTVIHAARQVPDPGYYYQDGRPAWNMATWSAMGLFIQHFTTLDADAWDHMNLVFDGPGGIATVAAFCSPNVEVVGKPNMGHVLTTLTGADKSSAARKLGIAALADNPNILRKILREE